LNDRHELPLTKFRTEMTGSEALEARVGPYVLLEQIHTGGFTSIWLAEHETLKMKVAVKKVPKANITTDDQITRLTRELSLLKQLHHPFIAEFFESIEDDENYYYAMEYAEHGNLLNFVNTHGNLPESQSRFYFCQIISVLEYLHNVLSIVHRDLRTENILLDRHDNIRVIDFGFSVQSTATHPLMNTKCGSPSYAAPEMIRGQAYTRSADIWSAGVVLYVLVTGDLPFRDDNMQRLLQKIVYTDVTCPPFLSPAVTDLIRKMLAKNPDTRITIDKIKEHHWFSQSQYSRILAFPFSLSADSIDKEIIDEIANRGIECRTLSAQLLAGEFTDLTAEYRIIWANKRAEMMRDRDTSAEAIRPRVAMGRQPGDKCQSQRVAAKTPGRVSGYRTAVVMPLKIAPLGQGAVVPQPPGVKAAGIRQKAGVGAVPVAGRRMSTRGGSMPPRDAF